MNHTDERNLCVTRRMELEGTTNQTEQLEKVVGSESMKGSLPKRTIFEHNVDLDIPRCKVCKV